MCDVIRLRGRSSELCTDGLIEPGESVTRVRSVLLSRRCDFGLYVRFLQGSDMECGLLAELIEDSRVLGDEGGSH